jgi:glutaminyl-peptide cyclotransferase
MAGSEDKLVVGTLHLLLLQATVLSLTAGNLSLVSAAWTQEKVRGHCCVLNLSGVGGCQDLGLGHLLLD